MKTTNKIGTWATALLTVALVNGVKADDTSKAPANPDSSYQTKDQARSTEGAPAKCNKASGIIGMEVKNQNDEKLGHIKDVVFDLNTERVSYAVMTASHTGFAGMHEKLLAVPLNALKLSYDQKYLILNADKAKVEAAAGFERDNWPSVGNPSWGAQPFWQTGDSNSNSSDSTKTPNPNPSTAPNSNPSTPNPTPAPDQQPNQQ